MGQTRKAAVGWKIRFYTRDLCSQRDSIVYDWEMNNRATSVSYFRPMFFEQCLCCLTVQM